MKKVKKALIFLFIGSLIFSCSSDSDPVLPEVKNNPAPPATASIDCVQPQVGNIADLAPAPAFSGWAVPASKVYDGGPGVDGIPALENTIKSSLRDALKDPEGGALSYIEDTDLVVGIRFLRQNHCLSAPYFGLA